MTNKVNYINPFRFYVYAYLRSKDSTTGKKGTPYYIGKGQGRRAFQKHGWLRIPPDKNNIIFLETNLTEIGALAIERFYIRWYGRKDSNVGILWNKTDGGDGLAGAIKTEAQKQHLRKINTGKKQSDDTKNKRGLHKTGSDHHSTGKPRSIESKEKNRIGSTGKKQSQSTIDKRMVGAKGKHRSIETKNLISIAQKGIPQPKVICPHCGTVGGRSVMKRHHFDNCKHLVNHK
jgi:hypothetical protein